MELDNINVMRSLDVPAAPRLLGQLLGAAVTQAALPLAQLPELCAAIESAEPKRDLAAHTLKFIQVPALPGGLMNLWTGAFHWMQWIKLDLSSNPYAEY